MYSNTPMLLFEHISFVINSIFDTYQYQLLLCLLVTCYLYYQLRLLKLQQRINQNMILKLESNVNESLKQTKDNFESDIIKSMNTNRITNTDMIQKVADDFENKIIELENITDIFVAKDIQSGPPLGRYYNIFGKSTMPKYNALQGFEYNLHQMNQYTNDYNKIRTFVNDYGCFHYNTFTKLVDIIVDAESHVIPKHPNTRQNEYDRRQVEIKEKQSKLIYQLLTGSFNSYNLNKTGRKSLRFLYKKTDIRNRVYEGRTIVSILKNSLSKSVNTDRKFKDTLHTDTLSILQEYDIIDDTF